MTKFTPGPWAVRPGFPPRGKGPLGWEVGAQDFPCVCTNYLYYAADDEEASQANARLIAAAPDMYAALQLFIIGANVSYVTALEIARAAIAKADGEVK